MIFISLGKWSHSSGRFLIKERYYYYGKWTPFVRVKIKGLRLTSEMASGEIVSPNTQPFDGSVCKHEHVIPKDVVAKLDEAVSVVTINVNALDAETFAELLKKHTLRTKN